mmetsp:Transcript_30597/g.42365  ORF Transcript_30597/g.42365 Transcript_30597/m.42365 type:complete len:217 (+) Transcript_30597:712-1362(+)
MQQIFGDLGSRDSPIHHTVKEGVPPQTIAPMHTPSNLTRSIQTMDGTLGPKHLTLGRDRQTAHAVVQDRAHDGNVEGIVDVKRSVLEELLSEGARLGVRRLVVLLKSGGEDRRGDAHILSQISSCGVGLHHPARHVVLAVPLNLFGSLAVQHKSVGPLAFPHLASDIVPPPQLITEALSVGVQQQPAHTTQRLCSQELNLGIWLVWVDQSCGMHLH